MAIVGNILTSNTESIETDASGWAAVLNANTLTRASGGTLGAFSLSFKAVAAGDCQVGLAARVTAVPGLSYLAYASVWTPVAAGLSRIEIRWYNAGGTLISTTTGPQMTAAAPSWNQVAVVGAAPPGSTTANVVIRVLGTAAAQSWFADRIFFGQTPTVVTGNLLDWPTQDIEIDTSSWAVAANATLGVQPAAAFNYQALKVTSASAGDASAQTVATPAVTPGVEYMAYAYLLGGAPGQSGRIQVQWRTAGGTTISTSSVTWATPSTSWTRATVIDVAPAGAATARVVVTGVATAGAQTWGVDRVVFLPTSVVGLAGNLLPYNVADIEQNATPWTTTGGTGVQSTEQVLNGAYSLKMTSDGVSDLTTSTLVTGITPGLGYKFMPAVRRPVGVTHDMRTRIEWLNGAGDVIRTRWQTWNSVGETWAAFPTGDLAPPNAVSARISVIVLGSGAGQVWYLDRTFFGIGGLTVQAAPAPGGGAAITIRGLTTGGPAWMWSLTRVIAGEPEQPVRGWTGDLTNQTTVGDVAVITDYEAPLGVPVSWYVRTVNPVPPGSISYASDPLILDAEELAVWLKDPGLPARSVRAVVSTPLPTWTRAARQGVRQVRGRARPVVISDVRSSRTGSLTLVTETDADVDALWWVLDPGGPLLLQWPPGWGERDMYVSVGDVSAAPVVELATYTDRTWVLSLTEVDRPVGGMAGSADRTWQTVEESADTWADALAKCGSWLDVYTGVEGP
ncbi:hypothetical protein [Streptomyces sp. NPDC006638]|uniref:hypothetical protein n=1 Tax=Streptomyces sp. NPDC006638 TaxID=3157183 RepID=UPI0033BEC5CF